jgi:hypothetical protein
MSPSPDHQERPPALFSINRETLVPIGLLISVVVCAITGTAWIQRTILDLDHKISELTTRVESMNDRMNDRWTYSMQAAWADLLQARNPTMNVPPPLKPR